MIDCWPKCSRACLRISTCAIRASRNASLKNTAGANSNSGCVGSQTKLIWFAPARMDFGQLLISSFASAFHVAACFGHSLRLALQQVNNLVGFVYTTYLILKTSSAKPSRALPAENCKALHHGSAILH
eukprot:5859901-Amphidinium_carterae.1